MLRAEAFQDTLSEAGLQGDGEAGVETLQFSSGLGLVQPSNLSGKVMKKVVGFATHAAVDAHDKGHEVNAMAIEVRAELGVLGVLAEHNRKPYLGSSVLEMSRVKDRSDGGVDGEIAQFLVEADVEVGRLPTRVLGVVKQQV